MRKIRRKRRFIDRPVQLALVFQSLKHWLVFLFAAFALLSFIQLLFSTPDGSFIGQLEKVWSEHALFFVVAVLIAPVFAYDIISLSHRFVGPVWRVRQELRRIAEGKTGTPVLLRKNDFWQDLASDFNAALERIDSDKTTAVGVRSHDNEEPVANQDAQLVNV